VALVALAAAPAQAQGGSTCTLCNPGAKLEARAENGVVSQMTVPKGRLTLASLVMESPLNVGADAVHFLRYGATSRLDVGVGYWAEPGKLRPAANWQALQARGERPAILVGYGSEPVGKWEDDGAYVSLVKPFGPREHRSQAFLAYFREIDGGTNHLIGGVLQPLGGRWSAFVGRYPFNSWDASVTYQFSPQVQVGVWVCDFARSSRRVAVSLGTGWKAGP
jgi:hypothetical protein